MTSDAERQNLQVEMINDFHGSCKILCFGTFGCLVKPATSLHDGRRLENRKVDLKKAASSSLEK
jgi:hypothetical protein